MDNLAVSIQAVINTLNIISVNGEQNLNHMLGSIQTLRNVKAELEKGAKCSEVSSEHQGN
jgi:hypothetical protein